MLPYKQAEEQLDIHLLYNHPLGRAETMNELAPMVSVGATDHQIEGEITPLFNASGLSERQTDRNSADLQPNKAVRRKKRTRKYQNTRKVRFQV